MTDELRQHAPATLRNREPITRVLRSVLPPAGLVLEVASGTGEHIAHFARQFPGLVWQPSDLSPGALRSVAAWSASEPLANVRPPLLLDAADGDWPIDRANAVICINMLHISPWQATMGLMAGAGRILSPGAPLYIYGPFRRSGRTLEPSNAAFDQQLRDNDTAWGLRNLAEVTACAADHGFVPDTIIEMPANNLSLVLRKA